MTIGKIEDYWKNKKNTSLSRIEIRALLSEYPSSNVLFYNQIQKVTDNTNVIIAIRKPNAVAENLLEEGYPSKNFHMKAKSSVAGPTAGFIPYDPSLSKSTNTKNQEKYISEALNKGSKAVSLILSKQQIKVLIDNNVMFYDKETNVYSGVYNNNQVKNFLIDENGYVSDASTKQPILVLTSPREYENEPDVETQRNSTDAANIISRPDENRPIIADYDLFDIIPLENRANNNAHVNVPPRLSGDFKNKDGLSFLDIVGKEDSNMGNPSYYTKTIIDKLNDGIAVDIKNESGDYKGYYGGKLFWHGDESHNPYSPGFDPNDAPIFFIPGQKKPIYVTSLEQLERLYETFEKIGYRPDYSARIGVSRLSSSISPLASTENTGNKQFYFPIHGQQLPDSSEKPFGTKDTLILVMLEDTSDNFAAYKARYENALNKYQNVIRYKIGLDGDFVTQDNIPLNLGDVSIEVLGHGEEQAGLGRLFSGLDEKALAEKLTPLMRKYLSGDEKTKLTLLGCQLGQDNADSTSSFASSLGENLRAAGFENFLLQSWSAPVYLDLANGKRYVVSEDQFSKRSWNVTGTELIEQEVKVAKTLPENEQHRFNDATSFAKLFGNIDSNMQLPGPLWNDTKSVIDVMEFEKKVPTVAGAYDIVGLPLVVDHEQDATQVDSSKSDIGQFGNLLDLGHNFQALQEDFPQIKGKAFVGYQSESDGKISIVFADLNDSGTKHIVVRIDDPAKAQSLRSQFDTLNKSLMVFKQELSEPASGGVDGLNTAMLFQALLNLANGFGDVPNYIKAQAYLGIVQGGVQIVGDIADTVTSLRVLTASASGSKILSALGDALSSGVQVFGLLSGAVSFGFDAKELDDALRSGDSAAISGAGVKLGFSGLSLGLMGGAFVSGFLGASTVSAVTGGLAVPVAGLAIGISALIDAVLHNGKVAAAGFSFIHTINDAYSKPLTLVGDKNQAVMMADGAAVQQIDFRSNTVKFSNVTIGSSGAARNGYWWTSRANNTDVLWVDNPVNAYSYQGELGYSRTDNLALWDATGHDGPALTTLSQELRDPSKALILMTMPELDADYLDYVRTDFNSDTLVDTIQKKSDAKVVLSTNDHSASNWKFSSFATTLEIVLDDNNRTMILPGISDYEKSMLETPGSNGLNDRVAKPYDQSLVTYRLIGGGGNYILSLPADGTVRRPVTLVSGTKQESWSFHLSGGLFSGGKSLSFEGDNKFCFNGQEIVFSEYKGEAIALIDDQVPDAYVSLDIVNDKSMLVVQLGRWSKELDPKAAVDAVLKKLQPVADAKSDIITSMKDANDQVWITTKVDYNNKSAYYPKDGYYFEDQEVSGYYNTKTNTAVLVNSSKDRIFSYDGSGWNQVWDVGVVNWDTTAEGLLRNLNGLDIFWEDSTQSWVLRSRQDSALRKEIHLPVGTDFSRITLIGTTDSGERISITLPQMYQPGATPATQDESTSDVFTTGEARNIPNLTGTVKWEDSHGIRTFRHGQLVSVQLKWDESQKVERPTISWGSFSDLNPFSTHPLELPTLIGTDNGEILVAQPERALALYGQGGDDKLTGSTKNDELYGGDGNDELLGDEGNDFLHGGTGADIIDGGAGEDTVSFSGEKNKEHPDGVGVSIMLRKSQEALVFDADADGDRITNVENVIGSEFDDEIYGDDNANILYGRGGDDWLSGGGGNDTLIGGAGNDVYELDKWGLVTIDAQDNGDSIDTLLLSVGDIDDLAFKRSGNDLAIVGDETFTVLRDFFLDANTKQRYQLASQEKTINQEDFVKLVMASYTSLDQQESSNILAPAPVEPVVLPYTLQHMLANDPEAVGDEKNNVIYSNLGSSKMFGNDGNDILYGGGGDDKLVGGTGNDLLLGGAGNDTLDGSGGENVLIGGDGRDTYVFDINKSGRIVIVDNNSNINKLLFQSDTPFSKKRLSTEVSGTDLIIRVDNDPNRQVTVLDYYAERRDAIKDVEFSVSGQSFTNMITMSDLLGAQPIMQTDLPGGPRRAWDAWGKQALEQPEQLKTGDAGYLQQLVQAMSTFNVNPPAATSSYTGLSPNADIAKVLTTPFG